MTLPQQCVLRSYYYTRIRADFGGFLLALRVQGGIKFRLTSVGRMDICRTDGQNLLDGRTESVGRTDRICRTDGHIQTPLKKHCTLEKLFLFML